MSSVVPVVVRQHHTRLGDEEIKMLGRMTNIVFDDEGMEGLKLNPIIVYDSNDEPKNGEGLIHNNKDVCAHCNRQGHQQEDCGTPMHSFQHCPICAWTKQASCTVPTCMVPTEHRSLCLREPN